MTAAKASEHSSINTKAQSAQSDTVVPHRDLDLCAAMRQNDSQGAVAGASVQLGVHVAMERPIEPCRWQSIGIGTKEAAFGNAAAVEVAKFIREELDMQLQ